MPDENPERQRLNPQAMAIPDASRLLSALGFGEITVEMLTEDVEAGAPTNADGTFNVLHYAAWLIKERTRGD